MTHSNETICFEMVPPETKSEAAYEHLINTRKPKIVGFGNYDEALQSSSNESRNLSKIKKGFHLEKDQEKRREIRLLHLSTVVSLIWSQRRIKKLMSVKDLT